MCLRTVHAERVGCARALARLVGGSACGHGGCASSLDGYPVSRYWPSNHGANSRFSDPAKNFMIVTNRAEMSILYSRTIVTSANASLVAVRWYVFPVGAYLGGVAAAGVAAGAAAGGAWVLARKRMTVPLIS